MYCRYSVRYIPTVHVSVIPTPAKEQPVSAKRPVGISPRDLGSTRVHLIFASCPTTPPSLASSAPPVPSNAVIRSKTCHLICSPSTRGPGPRGVLDREGWRWWGGRSSCQGEGDTAGDGNIERKPSGNVMPRCAQLVTSSNPTPSFRASLQPHVAS
jgi:hypothetical protein